MDSRQAKLRRDETLDRADEERAARLFYEGVLGGRQVWLTGPRTAPRTLWFLIGATLIPVRAVPNVGLLEVLVESPTEVAERCWDAGYTVRFRGDDTDDLIVIDPFGRQLVLTARTDHFLAMTLSDVRGARVDRWTSNFLA